MRQQRGQSWGSRFKHYLPRRPKQSFLGEHPQYSVVSVNEVEVKPAPEVTPAPHVIVVKSVDKVFVVRFRTKNGTMHKNDVHASSVADAKAIVRGNHPHGVVFLSVDPK